MSYGYNTRLIEANKQADDSSLGVRLGRWCIKHNVSVIEISRVLSVSRATVYNWFSGMTIPSGESGERIEGWLGRHSPS